MTFFPRTLALATLVLLGLTVVPAVAATPTVRDEAGLFSADAIKRAERTMERIEREAKRDVVVETYNTLPGKGEELSREQVFEWARERARELRVQGIYILICKKPSKFQVLEGNATEKVF